MKNRSKKNLSLNSGMNVNGVYQVKISSMYWMDLFLSKPLETKPKSFENTIRPIT
jgi:hypothetical protein